MPSFPLTRQCHIPRPTPTPTMREPDWKPEVELSETPHSLAEIHLDGEGL